MTISEADALELEAAWRAHVAADTGLLERLLTRHRERQRRYHTVAHVAAVVRHVTDLAGAEPMDDLGAVVAAAFYHDAIYEPQHPANERASARLARRDLQRLGWPPQRVAHVASMIEATQRHADPADADTAVLFDADLAILGSAPTEYRAYAGQVRAEYAHVDDAQWRVGRAAVLAELLDRAPLYATATGRSRWEDAARSNLAAELSDLRG